MRRAIELAWRGWGRVAPNPLVGCVLLKDGEVVGDGWHAEFGGVHAERLALAAAGERARGATAVVSLEPCAHHGKQPPCADALVEAGVARVVTAIPDPNPEAGGGAARLWAAGIEVHDGVEAEAARRQNAAFLHRFREPRRPWVVIKLALSLDGRIADALGRSRWISGKPARAWVHWLRAGFDAIAVGGATVRADNPALTVRGEVTPRRPPRRVVFAGQGELPAQAGLLSPGAGEPTVVVAPPGAPALAVARAAGAEVIVAASLEESMEQLRQAGVESLLVEGGGRLAGALLGAGLVDRCCLLQAPIFLGSAGVPAVGGWPGMPLPDTAPWVVVERRDLGADTLLVLDRT